MPRDDRKITALLVEWRRGDCVARDALITLVYPELKRLARFYLRQQRRNHTLQPTALVHELYIRLLAPNPVSWQNRAHFFAIAAQQLRRILIDYARYTQAAKRGAGQVRVTLTDLPQSIGTSSEDLFSIEEALRQMEAIDPRTARVVELRFFGGLQDKEVANALGISIATVKRDWDFARAWLSSRLGPSTAKTSKV